MSGQRIWMADKPRWCRACGERYWPAGASQEYCSAPCRDDAQAPPQKIPVPWRFVLHEWGELCDSGEFGTPEKMP